VIDADGNRAEDIQYKAWGETLAQTGSDAVRRKYTGQIEADYWRSNANKMLFVTF
jgi:hypothetical protein